jgi:uncharacterized protein YndB with AHSA1/START domain
VNESDPNAATVSANEVTLIRFIDAPARAVWNAWTVPEHFASWFGTPPFVTPVDRVAMDVRPGGQWRAVQIAPDGTELPFAGVYLEVVEPERLVFTFGDPEDSDDPNAEIATVILREREGGTEMELSQKGHLPAEQYPKLAAGYSLFFDRMREYLARG